MKTLQQKIDEVFASKITSYSVDLLTNSIKMDLSLLDDGVTTEHTVEFLRVATMYFINDSTERRKTINTEVGDGFYLELTDMGFMDYEVDTLLVSDVRPDFTERLQGAVNFYVDIWSKVLFLEAAEVRIDGESFVIGDW